jgi:hypothetical protein
MTTVLFLTSNHHHLVARLRAQFPQRVLLLGAFALMQSVVRSLHNT